MRNQLDIFDHDPARMAAANRAAAERALHDVQFTATVRQERHAFYVGEAERWEHLAAHSALHQQQGHAGMSNDNKTLADVQPGGKVRLADGLPPLPKAGYVTGGDFGHEAHNAFTPEQMRDYAIAALSAQPSPAGQGD